MFKFKLGDKVRVSGEEPVRIVMSRTEHIKGGLSYGIGDDPDAGLFNIYEEEQLEAAPETKEETQAA